jgi:ribosomal protein L32E
MQEPEKTVRHDAMERAKLAVRAYAREPSEKHAREVEEAWRRIRRFDAVVRWRAAGRGTAAALLSAE